MGVVPRRPCLRNQPSLSRPFPVKTYFLLAVGSPVSKSVMLISDFSKGDFALDMLGEIYTQKWHNSV
jgi:hypothetical protein